MSKTFPSGGLDRWLRVTSGSVGPFGRRACLTIDPAGRVTRVLADLQDPAQRAEWCFDLAPDALRRIWRAVRAARVRNRAIATETVDGDFVEVSVASGGRIRTIALQNGWHRETILLLREINAVLPREIHVRYSFLDNPTLLAVRAEDR